MPHMTAFARNEWFAVSAVSQSGWTYGLRPEASAGGVGGGFGCAGTSVTGIQGELTAGVAGRQQVVDADHEGADSRSLQPKAGQQTQGGAATGWVSGRWVPAVRVYVWWGCGRRIARRG